MKTRLFRILFLTIIGLAVVAAFIAFEKKVNLKAKQASSQVDNVNIIQTPLELGGDFELVTNKGEKLTNKDLEGKIVLMFFGYTYCPDYCPMELQNLTEVLNALEESGLDEKVQPVFVSIDPERDTPEVLTSFLKPFHKKIIAATGSLAQIEEIKQNYRVYGARVEQEVGYLMDHSTFLYVLDGEGKLLSMVRYEATAPEITDYLKSVLNS
jgi:cytochrome oxidase Cu insertion factor (SCO1/SenC/PrrC family)